MKKETILIIMGKLNGGDRINHWEIQSSMVNSTIIGDYAIVENKKGYDLVEILGIAEYNSEQLTILVGSSNIKKCKAIIKINELEEKE